MRIVWLNWYYDADIPDPPALLARYEALTGWCRAVARCESVDVHVIQRFHTSADVSADGVTYHFVADALPPRLRWHHRPRACRTMMTELRPSVVHAHGLPYLLPYFSRVMPARSVLLWQHHGGPDPPRERRLAYWNAFRAVDGVLFTSIDMGSAWKKERILPRGVHVYEIPESSTRMTPVPRDHARQLLGIEAAHVFLFVGRLDQNKDPLAALRAFRNLCSVRTDVLLLVIYSDDLLLNEVERAAREWGIQSYLRLRRNVPHSDMHLYYSASDFLVSASHSEGSGFALIEALACGVYPVVPSIPAFRSLTRFGEAGALWRPGDEDGFSWGLNWAIGHAPARETLQRFFRDTLSFEAIGSAAVDVYRTALSRAARLVGDRNG